MKQVFYLLRHAETKMNLSIIAKEWPLSKIGRKQSEKLKSIKFFREIEVVACSSEKKAQETAKPLANFLGLKIITEPRLGEIGSDKEPIKDEKEFYNYRSEMFKDWNYSYKGRETANEGLRRFKEALKELEEKYPQKKILIVSHLTILSLYFAELKGQTEKEGDKIHEKWLKLCIWKSQRQRNDY